MSTSGTLLCHISTTVILKLCLYCSVSAPSRVKEQKQVRVYQWHSLVSYFNNRVILKLCLYCSVSAPSLVKEQKQVRVYQWHSLVSYFNNSDIKAMPVLFSFSTITGEGTEAGACLHQMALIVQLNVPYFISTVILKLCLYCSVSAPSRVKEQKQVRVYQWHSLVPYFNNSDIKAMPVLFSFSTITGEGTEAGACLPVALSCAIFQQQ